MEYINRFLDQIVNPIIILLFALALVYFLYGLVIFIANADSEEARDTGKSHMLWGIVGLFIMVSVYGILKIVIGTVGISSDQIPSTLNTHLR